MALVRLVAPELQDPAHKIILIAGYLLVLGGMLIISLATRRKGPDAFKTVSRKPARDSKKKDEK